MWTYTTDSMDFVTVSTGLILPYWMGLPIRYIQIAISRAIYKDTPIIILDEPTAALDPKSESEIYEQFNELSKNKLAIFISHRMASTRFCDNIIVFKNGSIEEMGSHYELMKAHSVYWKLFNMQSKYYMNAESGKL